VGSGWYRCIISGTVDRTGSIDLAPAPADNDYLSDAIGDYVYIYGAQLVSGSTAKPYFPTTDRLNVPRIDYTGGGCGSLLLEPQRTNSQTYSEDLTQASAWGVGSVTILANDTTSPDGTTNADKVVEFATTARHELYGKSLTYSGTTSVSFFAKASGRRYFSAFIGGNPTVGGATFDLQTGTITATSGGTIATIEEHLNGWYRCSFTSTFTGTTKLYVSLRTNGGSPTIETYAGDGVSGIYLWGCQTEIASSYPTSYIPTSGTTVTRVADASSTTGLSSVINDSEGTFYFEIEALANSSSFRNISISDGSTSNLIALMFTSNNQIRLDFTNQAQIYDTVTPITQMNKIAVSYKLNEVKLYVNGALKGTDTSANMPTGLSTLRFDNTISAPFEGKVQNIIIFPTTLTDQQIQAL
jgi:hypothetical protein